MSQLSLFSAAAREPQVADLEGLLAGSGQVVRRGDAGRISVVVPAGWRHDALLAEMAALRMPAEVDRSEPGGVTVRTPWLPELRAIADAWTHGAVKVPPPGWALDGARLRWWCLAEGSVGGVPTAPMYTLALGPNDEPAWLAVGSALAAAGIAGVLVGPRADGPAYRIVGQRRLARLRELVGDPPDGVPEEGWPPVPMRS
ncbi:MAG TPA: hypothetical protein VFJ17_07035 [Mycobacteriales bacterium]|jgi:hypothetical protein|nr:hypothetical protein [Mycobacteriales bacterium]